MNKQNTSADKKRFFIVSSVLVATSLSLMCAAPVMAQSSGTQGNATTASSGMDNGSVSVNDGRTTRPADYSWLGLLGLAGLLGLRKQHTAVRQDAAYQPATR